MNAVRVLRAGSWLRVTVEDFGAASKPELKPVALDPDIIDIVDTETAAAPDDVHDVVLVEALADAWGCEGDEYGATSGPCGSDTGRRPRPAPYRHRRHGRLAVWGVTRARGQ